MGLRSKISKKFNVKTESKHSHKIMGNVLDRKFSPSEPSKVWVCEKFSNTLDLYKIVTRSMSRKANYRDNVVTENFFKTLKSEQIYHNKLIHK